MEKIIMISEFPKVISLLLPSVVLWRVWYQNSLKLLLSYFPLSIHKQVNANTKTKSYEEDNYDHINTI